MTAAHTEDGELKPALHALADAIAGLIEPVEGYINGETRYAQPIYMQLYDELAGAQGGGFHAPAKSIPPLWVEGLDLLTNIDSMVEIWQPAYTGTPPTVGRLKWLLQRKWRPQDTEGIHKRAAIIEAWTLDIQNALDPPTQWTLPDPCPRCKADVAYKPDGTGTLGRVKPLQISPEVAHCLVCRAKWVSDYFPLLGKMLGRPLPPGVLE